MRGVKLGMAAVISGVVVAGASAAPALADTFVGACSLTGTVAATVPLAGPPSNPNYSFQQLSVTCHGTASGSSGSATGTFAGQVRKPNGTNGSVGTFTNQMCGTGTAWSESGETTSLTLVAGFGSPGPYTVPTSYVVTFTAFHGLLDWQSGQGITTPPDTVSGTGLPLGGPVSIQPDVVDFPLASPGSGICANGFSVEGMVAYSNGPVGVGPPPGLSPVPYPSSTFASQACRAWPNVAPSVDVGTGGGPPGTDIARAYVYVAQATSSKVAVCARAQTSAASAGGRLEVDTAGSPGVAPVVQVADSDTTPASCTQQGPNGGVGGVTFNVMQSPSGSNPASVCVTAGGTMKRITVGTSSSAPAPLICWYPDPDTSVSQTCKP
jgi:hypothetical protein